MKAKTIEILLRKKVDNWLSSIKNEKVVELARENTIITGGCIASMLLHEKVNDYDFYFRNKETAKAVAHYYVSLFNESYDRNIEVVEEDDRIKIHVRSAGVAAEKKTDVHQFLDNVSPFSEDDSDFSLEQDNTGENPNYHPVFITCNAITLSNRIQLVLRFYGDPDTIHESYDFIHCTNYWCCSDSKLVLRKEALLSLLEKNLYYTGSKYPLCSIIRTRKFISRNWTCNAGQYLKMCMQLNNLDLTSIDVLEDQLIGVDIIYFSELLSSLRDKCSDKVNHTYLMEIIDRMF